MRRVVKEFVEGVLTIVLQMNFIMYFWYITPVAFFQDNLFHAHTSLES
jgi:hypothetical protein